MKLARNQIRLSPHHPSLLPQLSDEPGPFAPLIVDSTFLLIDGYRRYRIDPSSEFEVMVHTGSDNIYAAARSLNLRTRAWDDVDCFLWRRWALSMSVDAGDLPVTRFPSELATAGAELLSQLASRRITLRQATLILQVPETHRAFFLRMFSQTLELNNNESKDFMEMCIDLKKTLSLRSIEEVLPASIMNDASLNRRTRSQKLMNDLRTRRYPQYTARMEEFAEHWKALDLGDSIQVARSLFVERGKLEITLNASNHEELLRKVEKLHTSLNSPLWLKIWD